MSPEQSTKIRLDLARGHRALGEYADAVLCLERAAESAPDDDAVLDLAREFAAEPGADFEGGARERLNRLIAELDSARSASADAAAAAARRPPLQTSTMAELLADQGHSARALAVAEEVLRRDPNEPRALAVRERLSESATSPKPDLDSIPAPDLDATPDREPEPDSDPERERVIADLETWLARAVRRREEACP